MKIRSIFFYALFLINFIAFGGFPAGTLVYSGNASIPIEELHIGDLVTCYDFKTGYAEKPILATKTHSVDEIVFLVVNDREIVTAREQRFYLPDQKKWKKAVDLQVGDCLWGARLEKESLIIQQILHAKDSIGKDVITLYDISVKDCHNFLILENGILVHNWVPAIPACALTLNFVCDSLLAFSSYELVQGSLAVGTAALCAAIDYFRNDKNNYESNFNDFQPPQGPGPSGNYNNNDNNNNKSALQKAAEEAAKLAGANEARKQLKKAARRGLRYGYEQLNRPTLKLPNSVIINPVPPRPSVIDPATFRKPVTFNPHPTSPMGVRFASPLGRGSTGRFQSANFNEELAMKEIMANPRLGKPIDVPMTDKRWHFSDGWKKMSWNRKDFDQKGSSIEIHYVGRWENGVLVDVDDFKFK